MRHNKTLATAWVVFAIMMLFTGVLLRTAAAQEIKTDEQVLSEYVDYFHRLMKPGYSRRARRLIPPLIQHCRARDVDPLLVGCVFSFESSWRNFLGDAGEIGPGQIMPQKGQKWREIDGKRYDLSTLDGQVEAACAHMRYSLNTCKTIVGAFTHYGSGDKCKHQDPMKHRKMIGRASHYKEMVRKFR